MQNYESDSNSSSEECVCFFSVYEGNTEMKYAMALNNFLMFLLV